MTQPGRATIEHGNAYNIFILVLTIISLVIMVLLLLPINSATLDLLRFYDNFICVIFLTDFAFTCGALTLEVRLLLPPARLARPHRFLPGVPEPHPPLRRPPAPRPPQPPRPHRAAYARTEQESSSSMTSLTHRSQYATFITILLAVLVLVTASVVVLNAEQRSDNANIASGWDALWWSFVTITTVGYGDRYPVTVVGRIGAMFVMIMGIGIIGALASILASMLVSSPDDADTDTTAATSAPSTAIEQELAAVKSELAELRATLDRIDRRLPG